MKRMISTLISGTPSIHIRKEFVEVQSDGTVILEPFRETDDDDVIEVPEFEDVDEPEATVQSDIYCLGALLWITADWGLEEDHDPELNPDLEKLISETTEENPAKRPALADIISKLKALGAKGKKEMKLVVDAAWLAGQKNEKAAAAELEAKKKEEQAKEREAKELADAAYDLTDHRTKEQELAEKDAARKAKLEEERKKKLEEAKKKGRTGAPRSR
jgi:hypothetical protein